MHLQRPRLYVGGRFAFEAPTPGHNAIRSITESTRRE
jgi:hypothetical protein